MISIYRPTDSVISDFHRRQTRLAFNYPDVGCTSSGDRSASRLQSYDFDQVDIELGHGQKSFQLARNAIKHWQHFSVGWAEVVPNETEIAAGNIDPGNTVVVRARVLSVWLLAAVRVVDLHDSQDHFAYSIGTLPGHPEQGEERFELVQLKDGSVRYRISAYFRPNWTLARLSWPYCRMRFNRFRRESVDKMTSLASP